MVKQDYGYKQLIHKVFRNFIKKNLPVDRDKIKVLCLPGYNANEVNEVYQKLGIPLPNIFGVEKDRDVYVHLKKTQKFNIENIDLFDYVKSTSNNY